MSAAWDPALAQLAQRIDGCSPDLLQWTCRQLRAGHPAHLLHHRMLETGWTARIAQATLEAVHCYLQGAAEAPAPTPAPALYPAPQLQQWPSHIDVGDRQVQVLCTLEHPQVALFANLLSPQECQTLIDEARHSLERSRTVASLDSLEEVNDDRTSYGMFFTRGQTPTVRTLEARIARLLHWPIDHGEGLQVLRYAQGAQYKPHHDYFDPESPSSHTLLQRGGQRVATLIIYLNEVPAGGCTGFPGSRLRIQPQPGHALFFAYPEATPQSMTLHTGEPVLDGEKWIATKWLRQHTFQ